MAALYTGYTMPAVLDYFTFPKARLPGDESFAVVFEEDMNQKMNPPPFYIRVSNLKGAVFFYIK